MLVVDNIIDYYEENSGIYNLVFKPSLIGILVWLAFVAVNCGVVAMSVYHLWTGSLQLTTYLAGVLGYIIFFIGCLVWSSIVIRRKMWNIFETTSADKLRKTSYYELFRKSRIRHLKLTEIMTNKYRALKMLEYWQVINYLEAENFLQRGQIKDLIDFIYKRKEDELDLVILTVSFLYRILSLVMGIFIIRIFLTEADIPFEFGEFMFKGGITFGLLVLIIKSSVKENRIKKLIEILEDIYFRV